ncbi:MAG: hypothetical protein A4E57_03667 [Syntrophorhabdaceae bacterium PtaU1.Bin034]|jgi:hypothetical protein|nr:MAG: hypothetical protein A4E57_03667 [Syntrophorhabdaceae bacterium PtaU1.Bin034]
MKLDPQDIEAIAVRMAEILITRFPGITALLPKNDGSKKKPWNSIEFRAVAKQGSRARAEYIRTHEPPPPVDG